MKRIRALLLAVVIVVAISAAGAKIFLDSVYRIPILMYHSVAPVVSVSESRLIVSPETFARQMAFLRSRHYNVIPLAEAIAYIRARKFPPPKTVAITVDDGYEDNYTNLYPVLKRYRIPATIFMIVDKIGTGGFLTWDQLKEMQSSGLVEIESHTLSHPWLTGTDNVRLKDELEGSKHSLEARLDAKIRFLCYPMGGFDERVKRAAKAAGYEAAFATKPRRLANSYDPYEIKRVRVAKSSNNLFVFWLKLSGYHAFYRGLQDDSKDAYLAVQGIARSIKEGQK